MDKKDNIAVAFKVKVAQSTWPYKLEKKGKALDQDVEGPGRNAMFSAPSSSQNGDE
jgi:hypothetical protein